ncbi:5-carboxymethyl-2-hydroxymuconate Delta-isomerase [Limnobacter sp.]|uniref:5-carboxymethyl-2-hydroxymuconate Delta-isomerase n=1 Tax=Limnobacter sp. TaxID=2003368 RepID=UPI00258BC5CF|nr:5-carboxymethyl-2-hydroxymuconate Delta-isomerase [Limnobacter sp.]
MPHVTVEYSSNLSTLDVPWVLYKLNQCLVDLDIFQESDIKTRAYRADPFLIGLQDEAVEHAFFVVRVEMLSGRERAVKVQVGQALLRTLEVLRIGLPEVTTQLTVQVQEIEPEIYFKSYTTGD